MADIAPKCNDKNPPRPDWDWACQMGNSWWSDQEKCASSLRQYKKIAVVHNGIIANHEELKSKLMSECSFLSETDTEVIPHLIRHYMDSGLSFEDAFFAMTRELKGSYAILAMNASEPGKILAARMDAPLVIGLGDEANFIGSDVLSFYPIHKK